MNAIPKGHVGQRIAIVGLLAAASFSPLGATTQEAYLKALNSDGWDRFGISVAISGDTAIVGAHEEDSSATGVNGDQTDNSAATAGAAYIFARISSSVWSQQAYLKASNTEGGDRFGEAVAISGETAVVGARWEDSIAKGVNGDDTDNSQYHTGAAYVFARNGVGAWSQEAYLKPSNSDAYDFFFFGTSVGISGDDVIVGAPGESSSATGVNADQYAEKEWWNGAVYQFRRDALGGWSQAAYIKSSNCRIDDRFATSVAISGGTVIAGAIGEDSAATGVDGDQTDFKTNGEWVGASYIFDITASDPEIHITGSSVNGSLLTLHFRSEAGLNGWVFQGDADAQTFTDALTASGPVVEISPGHYTATVHLGPEPPDRYFVRVLRE
jgi:hypothetical protein